MFFVFVFVCFGFFWGGGDILIVERPFSD